MNCTATEQMSVRYAPTESTRLMLNLLEEYQTMNFGKFANFSKFVMRRLSIVHPVKFAAYYPFGLYSPTFAPYDSVTMLFPYDANNPPDPYTTSVCHECLYGPRTELEQFKIDQRIQSVKWFSRLHQDQIFDDMNRVAETIALVTKSNPDLVKDIAVPFFVDAARGLSYIERRKSLDIAMIYARQDITVRFPKLAYEPMRDISVASKAIIEKAQRQRIDDRTTVTFF